MMKLIPLGKSGLSVPSVAVGCMRLVDVGEKEAEALLDAALELGCNFFDHADIYGQGACESRFAQAVREGKDHSAVQMRYRARQNA